MRNKLSLEQIKFINILYDIHHNNRSAPHDVNMSKALEIDQRKAKFIGKELQNNGVVNLSDEGPNTYYMLTNMGIEIGEREMQEIFSSNNELINGSDSTIKQ